MKTRLHTCASTCDGRMEAIVEAGLAVEDEADSDRTRAAWRTSSGNQCMVS